MFLHSIEIHLRFQIQIKLDAALFNERTQLLDAKSDKHMFYHHIILLICIYCMSTNGMLW